MRRDLEGYASQDPAFDLALAVHAYSRALEVEVLKKLFVSFSEAEDAGLPGNTGNEFKDQSLKTLSRFLKNGKEPTLGQMAVCLEIVGCTMADDPDNGFAAHLDKVLKDRSRFCVEDGFPQRL